MESEMSELRTYGLPLVRGATQFDYERGAVAWGMGRKDGAYEEWVHLRNMADVLYPKLEWNPWLERQFRSMGESKWVCWAGCASAGKTYGATLYALLWWLCEPESTSIILTSTTGKALKRRAWAELGGLRRDMGLQLTGNYVDSRMMWQAREGDDKHAIIGLAVEDGGSVSKAVDNIKGLHTRRQMVVVDEATSTPEAVFEACANLCSSPDDFRMLVIGNPYSRLDAMGRFSEPAGGWETVCVDDEHWETKTKLDGRKGLVVRFDGERSPNVLAGKCLHRHLITMAKLQGLQRGIGPETPKYWSEVRGFWPPDGLVRTVFTEGEIVRQRACKEWVWVGGDLKYAAGFDPAFGGGDRAVLRFVKWGSVEGGMEGVQLGDKVQINVNAKGDEPPNFQMARMVREECERRGVTSDRLGVDASGGGRVFCDILEREWGKVIRIESGGNPSKRTVSYEDPRPATEAYDRKVTELWYSARELLMSGQLRGLDTETAVELCSRRYEDDRKKIVVETKDEYKRRHGKSPDLGDAACFALDAARTLGLVVRQVGSTALRQVEETDFEKSVSEVFKDVNYTHDNEEGMLHCYENGMVL